MWQARLTLPVLLVVLAVTPPLLLRSAGEHDDEYSLKGQNAPPWQVSSYFCLGTPVLQGSTTKRNMCNRHHAFRKQVARMFSFMAAQVQHNEKTIPGYGV